MSLSSFRAAVQSQLQSDLGITLVPGRLEGPIESRDLGCCWVSRVAEVGGYVAEEDIEVHVRIFKRYTAPSDPEVPYDPSPLEALAESIQASVKAHQTGQGPWYQRAVHLDLDPRTQGLEATIVGRTLNAGL